MQRHRIRTSTRHLSAEDRIGVVLERRGRRVVAFSINYRAFIHGDWHEVFRADTSHNRLHTHRYWSPHDGTPEFKENEAADDYASAFRTIMDRLIADWKAYRAYMERAMEGKQ